MEEVVQMPPPPEHSQRPMSNVVSPRGKSKAKHEIIELTDSDDEGPLLLVGGSDRRAHPTAVGQFRERRIFPLNRHMPDAASGSLENIPTKRRPKSKSVPLFLSSDEENEPPQLVVSDEEPIVVDNLPLPPSDPVPNYVAQVLEIIPDIDPEHLLSLVKQQYAQSRDNVVEPVLHALLEDPVYPKLDRKGKRKRVEEDSQDDERGMPKTKLDYSSKDREFKGGVHYSQLALDQLMLDFPRIPKPYLRQALIKNNHHYAPTHISLAEEKRRGGVLPYVEKTVPSRPLAKGKGKALNDDEFEKEREWIISRAREDAQGMDQVYVEVENLEGDDGIECGCCFSSYPFDKMVQCPEAHLFCSPCMTQYAETLLGSHDYKIVCMDQSGCKLPFPDAELGRFLTPKLLSLYERIKQNKEVEAAGIEGLEECPFCEFKCVIENDQEKLFVCRNEDCAAVSCRQCKQLDHLPKNCKEMEEDKNLDGRHTIEEAMTRALMRNCPRCQKAFIKDAGCNKMTCPNCSALSCYVCRKLITGYDHFAQLPGQPAAPGSSNSGKCILWDAVEQRHADEASYPSAQKALDVFKRAHPDVDEKDLRVEPLAPLPLAPPIPGV
ncbi:hypothetical protein GGX14DRAFT_591832, partial [Mycena pura]